jgi:hypothetical protein
MLVSNWAQNYWVVSTVAKKTLYDYKNVFGRVVEPFIGSKDLDEVSLMDIQKLVLDKRPTDTESVAPFGRQNHYWHSKLRAIK